LKNEVTRNDRLSMKDEMSVVADVAFHPEGQFSGTV
jgi:hypothetical protein